MTSETTAPDTPSAGDMPRPTAQPRAHFVPDTRPLQGRSGREPPSWAMALLVGIIGLAVLLFSLDQWTGGAIRSHLPFGGGDGFWVGLLFLPMLALLLVAAASKLVELRQAKSWVATTGRILSSDVETRRRRFQDEPEEDVPAVKYEFKVGGRTIVGTRVSIGDEGGLDMDAVLKRYPAGADVTVYYDPRDPTRCVLERDLAQDLADHNLTKRDVTAGCLLGLVELAAVGLVIWGLAAYGPDFVRAHFPRLHSHAEMPVALFGFGLVMLLFFYAARRSAKVAAAWPTVRGKIVRSEVEDYQERGEDSDGRTTYHTAYRPVVEYAYAVNGRDHRGNQIDYGMSVSAGQGYAEKVAAQYPIGSEVDVHYDPNNPSTSALRTAGAGGTWIVFGMALIVFALAAALAGVFG